MPVETATTRQSSEGNVMSSTSAERRRRLRSASVATAGVSLLVAVAQMVPMTAGMTGGSPAAVWPRPAAEVADTGALPAPFRRTAIPGRDGYGSQGDLFAVTDLNLLYRLDSRGRAVRRSQVPITGLAAGERLVGIDTRPANGQLYGVGSSSRLYAIDPASGAAAPVGPAFPTALSGTRFGVDFNPTVDRLRIVSDTGQNLRIDPTTGAVAGVDTALNNDGGQGTPTVTAAAYTNSVVGATTTALYDIDSGTDTLVLQGTKPGATPAVSPNTGRLFRVGSLGLDINGVTGFEILGAARGATFAEADYTALAAVKVRGSRDAVLVRIDLSTGRATRRGTVSGNVIGLTVSAGAPTTVYGSTTANELVRFDRRSLQVSSRQPITGLKSGEQVLGIDMRPANGQLYLLGSTSQVYVVNPATAAATAVGTPFGSAVTGSLVGFDVNPQADRLRVVTTGGQNLRLNPDTGAVAGMDTNLAYASGDPNAPFRSNVSHAAYTNNVAAATSTTLYDIDAALGVLATQQPPNDGTLTTVGSLGVAADGRGGFDIAQDGMALAALTPAGSTRTRIYAVNLSTGRARELGRLSGTALTGLAVAPRGVFAGSS
jgi:hypothetical protein